MLAVICAGVVPGVEVVTPACTFSTDVAPLVQNSAVVKFCDVVEDMYIPSVDRIVSEVSDNTKVVMIPNLFGNKIDWQALKDRFSSIGRNDIVLIEDSCDTITHTEASDICTMSFYASHIITSGGTGGMVMFNDESQYKLALRIRDWGRVSGNSEEILVHCMVEQCDMVTLPRGVRSITDRCFEGNTGLISINLSNLTQIGIRAFAGTSITSMEIPKTVRESGACCFKSYSCLESLTFNKGSQLNKIGREAFAQCSLKCISFPDGVEVTPEKCFFRCHELAYVTLGSSKVTIESLAFAQSANMSVRIFVACVRFW